MKLIHRIKFFIAKKTGKVSSNPIISNTGKEETLPSLEDVSLLIKEKKILLEDRIQKEEKKEVMDKINTLYETLIKIEEIIRGK